MQAAGRTNEILISWRGQGSLHASFSSLGTIAESIPPGAARDYRDELIASAPPVRQKSECRAQRDDGHARRHSESEFPRRLNPYRHWEWFAPRIGRSPIRVPAANAHSLRRSQGCKSPAVLLAMGQHFHAQATCSVRSIHIPEEAGSDAAKQRSPISPPA